MFWPIVFHSHSLSLTIVLLSILSTHLTNTSTSLFHTCQSNLRLDSYHLFYNGTMGATSTLSNNCIHNPILFWVNTHLSWHSHVCDTDFTFLSALYHSAFSPMQHCRSYSCVVKFSFKLKWCFSSVQIIIMYVSIIRFAHVL